MKNWENLRFYLAVARSGSATRAAQQLSVSHATVLRRIEQLENELGTRLFKRLQSGYQPTASGLRLLAEAEQIEEQFSAIELEFCGEDELAAGPLKVSQPESDVLNLFPLFAEFSQHHPDIKLEIHSSYEAANLNRHEADVAIRFTDTPPELLVGRRVGQVGFGLYAHPDYLARFEDHSRLEQFNWIIWQRREGGIQMSWLREQVQNPRVVLQTSSTSDVISAIQAGMGVGFVSNHVADNFPNLQYLSSARTIALFTVWILTHRNLRHTQRVKVFMRFIHERLSAQFAELEKLGGGYPSKRRIS